MYNIESIVGKILCQNQSVFRQKSANLKRHGLTKNITSIGCTHLFYQIMVAEVTACFLTGFCGQADIKSRRKYSFTWLKKYIITNIFCNSQN